MTISCRQGDVILVGVMIVVLAVIFAVWLGLGASLVAPMNRLIDSIRRSAGGDLVKPIEVDGSNGMGDWRRASAISRGG
ncbi:hypothetical protein ACLK19_29405 [Escherichia coli]